MPGLNIIIQAYSLMEKEIVYGSEIVSLTVSYSQPIVPTTAATSVTNTTATLNGTVNANNFIDDRNLRLWIDNFLWVHADATPNLEWGTL